MSAPVAENNVAAVPAAAFILNLTDRAADKVKDFAARTPDAAGKALRVFIQGGGCSGFQYGFTFDDKRPTDHVVKAHDVEVIVDPTSATKLNGATVDFIEDFRGAGFSVDNPNASAGCGCGKSFS